MKLILSTGCVKGDDVMRALQIAAQLGLNGIEMLLQGKEEYIPIEQTNRFRRKHGLKIAFVHAPFFQHRFCTYLTHPQKVAEFLVCNTFEIASKIGAQGVVVHPFPVFFRANYIRKLMATVLENHNHSDMVVAVENLERRYLGPLYSSPYCLRTGDELYRFACEHNYYITLDVAHCAGYDIGPKHFYQYFHDRIVNVHLSDCEASQSYYPIGTRTMNFEGFISSLHEYSYDGYLCLETDPGYEDKIF